MVTAELFEATPPYYVYDFDSIGDSNCLNGTLTKGYKTSVSWLWYDQVALFGMIASVPSVIDIHPTEDHQKGKM